MKLLATDPVSRDGRLRAPAQAKKLAAIRAVRLSIAQQLVSKELLMITDACSQCGTPAFDAAVEKRRPCPTCGSMARHLGLSINLEGASRLYLKTKCLHRHGGHRVVREVTVGDDFHRGTKTWNVMYRLIDRAGHSQIEKRVRFCTTWLIP